MTYPFKHSRFKRFRGRVQKKRIEKPPEREADGVRYYEAGSYGEKRKVPEKPDRCIIQMWGGFDNGQCQFKRRADSEGGEYCGRHDPIKIRAYNIFVDDENAWRDERYRTRKEAADLVRNTREAAGMFLKECAEGGVNDAAGLAMMIIDDPLAYIQSRENPKWTA